MMHVNNKQLVSVRLNGSDLSRVKRVAARLGVRESDVIRFALKTTLAKLAPLHNDNMRGADLLPVFVELGAELARHFEIDTEALAAIINDGVHDGGGRVAPEDIQLLAMAGMPEHYVHAHLRSLTQTPIGDAGIAEALRQYLYKKYAQLGADRPAPANPITAPRMNARHGRINGAKTGD